MNIPQTYNNKPLIHAWTYCAKDGAPFGVVARYQDRDGKKDCVPFFNPNGSAGIDLNPRPLFGLNKLAAHNKRSPVFIVEGEKSAAALQNIGLTAITSIGGANAAKQTDWTPCSGFNNVVILPDNNAVGQSYAKDVYNALQALELAPDVKVLRLPDLPDGGDVVDWLQTKVTGWNGYSSLESDAIGLKELFWHELENAEPVPDDWGLVGSAGSHSSDSELFQWETPNEIETKVPSVMAMTTDLIPEPFRDWLADVSHRMQTPPDFATVSTVVMVGSVIGAGCAIRPKRFDDWEVIPNVWGGAIAPPSCLKSPSMGEPMRMLDRLQAEYGKHFEAAQAENETDKVVKDEMLASAKKKISEAAKGKGKDGIINPDDMALAKASYKDILQSAPAEPARRLFKANETSVQSMTKLQNENPRGILVFRDELTGLLVKWDREDGQDERSYFLEGWNGNGSYTDNKIGRGLVEAKQICISLLGGIQPDKLKRYLYQALQGNNDGLMQRLQLAVWPDIPTGWKLIDIVPNKASKDTAYEIIKALAELDFVSHGAVMTEYDNRPHFHFTEPAQAVFNEWLTNLQTVKIPDESNPLMVEHFGKFRSLMPSLALIFHCIDIAEGKATGQVSEKAALLAVKWCDYLETHARRIYAMAESPEHEAAVRLADKVKVKKLPNPFTTRIIERKGWHGLKDKAEIEAACNILIDENWLIQTRKPKPPNGRPPLPEYQINPFFTQMR